jgi:WD40 repeat protein
VWREREKLNGRPLALIMDQVEEVFTRPSRDTEFELRHFLEALDETFANQETRPQGRLILGFRKEWESEIEQQLKEHKLPHANVFLQPLEHEGVIQAVTGITKSPRLQRQYGLVIEEGLPELMAGDLSSDPDSPLAPTLQVLLTKMWDEAKSANKSTPSFDHALYRRLKEEGILLGDFLDQQLLKLKEVRPEAVNSGLALDVLAYHTTALGTAEQRTEAQLKEEYKHQLPLLSLLVEKLKELYLVADPPQDQTNRTSNRATRLAHDTLAPLVRARLDNSASDGQRARRILENRSQEWRNGKVGAPLDGYDLTVVERGASGMRAWTTDEDRLIRVSRENRNRTQLRGQLLRVSGVGIALVVIGAIVTFWQFWQTKRQSTSRELAQRATILLQRNPELSLLLALQAMNQADTSESQEALRRALVESHLRTTLRGHESSVRTARFSPDARLVVTASADQARVWETNTGKTVAELKGHAGSILSAEFSRDGSRLVTASEDGSAKLWQTSTWTSVREFRASSGRVLSATFSPDGNLLSTTDSQSAARVWNAHNGQIVKELILPTGPLGRSEFSSDGKMMATFGDVVTIWDTSTWRQLAEFHGPRDKGSEENGSFSPDGKYIVSAQGNRGDQIARIWEISTRRLVGELKGHTHEIFNAKFSPDGRFIVTASGDKSARLWDTETWQNVGALWGHSEFVFDAEFSHDSKLVVTASEDETARVWSNTIGGLQTDLRGHTAVVNSAAFSPDGKLIVTASDDKTARVWKAGTGELVTELKGHTDNVVSAQFSSDGGLIVTASSDHTARVWQTNSGNFIAELKGHSGEVSRALFSPDSKLVITASADSTARVWEAGTGRNVATLKHPSRNPDYPPAVRSAVFSHDGKFIVTTSEFSAWVWNASTAELLSQLTPSTHATEGGGDVTIAEFSPDSKQIVIADGVGNVEVRGVKAEQAPIVLKGHKQYITKASFSPDGHFIITASADATTRVWEVNTGKTVLVLQGAGSEVFDAEFSPNGKFIVTGDQDNTARIWDAQSGWLITELKGSKTAIRKVRHNPDGKFILTVSQDDRVRIYFCEICESSENLIALARTRVTRPLTDDESRTYLH